MNTNKPKLIIDTDPGHDDALAMLMLLQSRKFDIQAITTVAGNAGIREVTRNAQSILDLLASPVPIFSGHPQPLKRKLVRAVVHGQSGLAGYDNRSTPCRLTANAPEKIVELVRAAPGKVTILAIGPLTNIAQAFLLDPGLPLLIKRLVIMGGAIEVPGNKNRVAEFNFFVDPEAADIVFRAPVPKLLVPIDICNKAVLPVEAFRTITNKIIKETLLPMMHEFATAIAADEGIEGAIAYDALAGYLLLNPTAFTLQPMDIVIETKGEHTFGMSVAERRLAKSTKNNTFVVTDVDQQAFSQDLFRLLSRPTVR